jgi:hypothetical protein
MDCMHTLLWGINSLLRKIRVIQIVQFSSSMKGKVIVVVAEAI